MKAQDLRIGNYVMAPLGEIMRIDQIGHLDFPDYIHARNETEFGQNGFEGIELTPEILEKCGFKRNGDKNSQYYFKSGLRYHPGSKHLTILRGCDKAGESQAGFCGTSLGDHIIINYLHQLQNLIHAITGQELEVKL